MALAFDIIKFGLVLFGGLTALTGFIDGWNNAFDWFGKNASFGDMLASGLAGIVQAFTGITDEEAKGIAENAAFYINGVIDFLTLFKRFCRGNLDFIISPYPFVDCGIFSVSISDG